VPTKISRHIWHLEIDVKNVFLCFLYNSLKKHVFNVFFGSFDVFMNVFLKTFFYKSVKTCFFNVFYLQINVFNIYDLE